MKNSLSSLCIRSRTNLLHAENLRLNLFKLLFPAFLAFLLGARAAEPCRIEVVEEGSGWPVPMVEFRTTHAVRFVSDNAGVIAFDLPELMGVETWFDITGHGYEVPKDFLGMRGMRLKLAPGKTLRVEMKRTMPARRMGRLTGGGLFGESRKLGFQADWKESGILGQDSVQTTLYNGKLHWAWGDTVFPDYPLGVFDMTGATTGVHPLASLEPPLKLEFDYFRNPEGKPKAIAKMPGEGPTWISGNLTLPDKHGKPHLVTSYQKIRNHLEAYKAGLAEWDDDTQGFKLLKEIWIKSDTSTNPPAMPEGHGVLFADTDGKQWALFGVGFPTLRCPATFEAWQDEKTWEALKPPASLSDPEGGAVKPHAGSIAWNPWRKRWVAIFTQYFGGPSVLGELWYAEASAPVGPWGKAVKVLTHEKYSFYNPLIHPEFTPTGSDVLFFEGTYTAEFSGNQQQTPRHNYNQILYRLDLENPALAPARLP